MREAWTLASINYGHSRVRSGVILLAALSEPNLRRRLLEASPSLSSVAPDTLAGEMPKIVEGASEDREVLADRPPKSAEQSQPWAHAHSTGSRWT
jgi:type VI secretion system protein VasG